MSLFHKDIVIPKNLKLPKGKFHLSYSDHARQAAKSDRYGDISLPAHLDTASAEVIEVETKGMTVVKVLYRVRFDELKDICLAIQPNGLVRTVWANLSSDKHKSLDRSKYVGG